MMKHIRVFMRSVHGFTLIELSIVLVIVGLVLSMSLGSYQRYVLYKKYRDTADSLSKAHEAISFFYFHNGRLPCPAPINPLKTKEEKFRELDCAKISSFSALTAKENDYTLSKRENKFVITGALPLYDLNLTDKQMQDAWNQQITYSVTLRLTKTDTYNQEDGIIEIIDQDGKRINWDQGDAQYVLISHGINGCSEKDNAKDQINCTDHTQYQLGDFSTQRGEHFYDDVLLFEEYIKDPNDFVEKSCDIASFISAEITDEELPAQLVNLHTIKDGRSVRICGDAALESMGYTDGHCRSYVCQDGQFIKNETIINF